MLQKLIKAIVVAAVSTAACVTLSAQGHDVQNAPSCSAKCVHESTGLCHFTLGIFYLEGIRSGLPSCIDSAVDGVSLTGSTSEIQHGIDEFEASLLDPSGLQIKYVDMKIMQAGAYNILGHRFFFEGNIKQGEAALAVGRAIFTELLNKPSLLTSQNIVQIAAGLMRSGSPLDSVIALQQLPPNDPRRKYMLAEVYFSMGDRVGAAKQYGEWIAQQCGSAPFMLILDDLGQSRVSYIQGEDSRTATRCEKLSAELRTRLEALKNETQYLKSLPAVNYPPEKLRPISSVFELDTKEVVVFPRSEGRK